MVRFDSRVWIVWSFLLLSVPLRWLIAMAAAVLIHELFHAVAILLLGGRIHGICVTASGVVIEASGIHGKTELLCAIAGPVGSFCLLLFIRLFPVLGLCGLIHGLFNLLPVYPLDGGRALKSILESIDAHSAAARYDMAEMFFLLLFVCVSLYISVRFDFGMFPFLFCIFMITNALLRKRLEKEDKSGYNSATI